MKVFIGTEPSRISPQQVGELKVLEDDLVAVVLNGWGIQRRLCQYQRDPIPKLLTCSRSNNALE
jgi:hypothetical protein